MIYNSTYFAETLAYQLLIFNSLIFKLNCTHLYNKITCGQKKKKDVNIIEMNTYRLLTIWLSWTNL